MARTQILTNNGETQYREARANGVNAVTVKAGATLAADIDFILPVALPVAQEFLAIDSSGQLSTSAGASGTLDEAYDSGGAGVGRIITADTGPVEAAGAGGFLASHTAPVYGLETTGVETNYRLTAGQNAGILEIQRGDVDADISDDTFDVFFALDGPNLRMGLNTVAPGTTAEFVDAAASKLTLQAAAANDASVIFDQAGTAQYEIGYDHSAGGLVIGETDFTQPVMFFEDTTFDVGIGELAPDARLHVTDSAASVVKVESTVAGVRIVLVDSTTTDDTEVGLQATGDDLELVSNAAVSLTVGAGGLLTASAWSIPADGEAIFGDSASAADTTVTIMAGANTQDSRLAFADVDSEAFRFIYGHGSDLMQCVFGAQSKMNIAAIGVGIGTDSTVIASDGTNTLAFGNGTAPSSSITNGVLIYAEDVASSSEFKVRDEAGNVTVLSPHSEVYGHKLSEDMAWSFLSEREGKYVWVDMLRVVRLLERLSGEELAFIGEAA